MSEKPAKVLALLPAYNEHVHIAAVINGAKKYLPVVVVDDGSKDNTSEVARENGAVVLRQEPNQGKGAAMERGFRYALENGFDAVITIDADGQHDTDEIPLFLAEFEKNRTDLIIGRRDFRKMPFIRMCSNTIGTWMFSNAMGQYIPDNQSGYRLISARLMEKMFTSKLGGFEFEVEMILRCVIEKYKLGWVTISTIYGDEKSHIHPIPHVIRFFEVTSYSRKVVRQAKKNIKIE
ncbi:MAG: glycosyltransferase family 2 protein [Anaerolineaceae bacterium]|nr:glycosyltransferase family 2 protein [Anaerolineaceae bacterium]